MTSINPPPTPAQTTEILTRPAAANKLKHSLVYFNLAADPIPAGAQIIKADFNLTVTGNRSKHLDEVHRMLTPWTETGATWNDPDGVGGSNGWNGSGGAFSSGNYLATTLGNFAPATKGLKTVSVINTVKDWAFNAVPNYGFGLISTGTDGGDAKYGAR